MVAERPNSRRGRMCGYSVEDLRQFSKFSRGAKRKIVVQVSFTRYLVQIYHDILRVYVFYPAGVGHAAGARQSSPLPSGTESLRCPDAFCGMKNGAPCRQDAPHTFALGESEWSRMRPLQSYSIP